MLSDSTIIHINRAIASCDTFALVIMPFGNTPVWFENGCSYIGNPDGKATDTQMSFEYSPWLGEFSQRGILGVRELQASCEITPETHSTTHDEYIGEVSQIISNCIRRDGKTVYSRVICGSLPDNHLSWGEMADRFFTRFPMAFRYLMYTPETKGWIGATPEQLLEFDKDSGKVSTVAFAGTRNVSETGKDWDEKNIRENRFVSDYICQKLQELGIEVHATPLSTVNYGNIEHLCSHISGISHASRLSDIMDAINPTPALCGFPKEDAIRDIDRYEHHKRNCYGGFVAVDSPSGYHAFVNLRCMHFHGSRYCIYGGGGIVPESVPEAEFNETAAKTAFLTELLGHQDV